MNSITPEKLNSPAFCTSWPLCILRWIQETSPLSKAFTFGKNRDGEAGHYLINLVIYEPRPFSSVSALHHPLKRKGNAFPDREMTEYQGEE
jgi:hypothetical protein